MQTREPEDHKVNKKQPRKWKKKRKILAPNFTGVCTTFLNPTILGRNLEFRPQWAFHDGKENIRRADHNLWNTTLKVQICFKFTITLKSKEKSFKLLLRYTLTHNIGWWNWSGIQSFYYLLDLTCSAILK